ncbi:hypothetical protein ABNX41_02580 [Rhodobacteraceae bacterium PA1-206B]
MVSRLAGALVRAFLVMFLVATPSAILPGVGADTKQMVALVALFAGALTFAEYNATYPSLVEFRDAAPFNRIRYLTLYIIVFTLSVMEAAGGAPTPFGRLFEAIGYLIGAALDFPYSPVRLATVMMAGDAGAAEMISVRSAAGTAYLLSVLSLVFFMLIMKLSGWPARHQAFNVWVNLPTFEPTAGGDVIERLERDARINISLGFLLPFLIPAVIGIGSMGLEPFTLNSPQTKVWTVAAWAFIPASLLMRGIAMRRIADMIRSKRESQAGARPGLAHA